jgi:hypothetical protein
MDVRIASTLAIASIALGQACEGSTRDGTAAVANAAGSGAASLAGGSSGGGLGGSSGGGLGGSSDGGPGGSSDGGPGGSSGGGLGGSHDASVSGSGGCRLGGFGGNDSGMVDAAPIPVCSCGGAYFASSPMGAPHLRLCRNSTCATVSIPGSWESKHIAFGKDDVERVYIDSTEFRGMPSFAVSWEWTGSGDPIKDGDVYSMELLDKFGRSIYFEQKSATYQKHTVACGGAPGVCIDLSELEGGVATGGGDSGPADGGAGCCPRDCNLPTSDPLTTWDGHCVSLGGTDYGGCYASCQWSCSMKLDRDPHGCEMWVPASNGGVQAAMCGHP